MVWGEGTGFNIKMGAWGISYQVRCSQLGVSKPVEIFYGLWFRGHTIRGWYSLYVQRAGGSLVMMISNPKAEMKK